MMTSEMAPERAPKTAPVGTAPTTAKTPARAARVRRHDLDWLRIMAVLLLIPFHSARVFDVWDPFYVKNAAKSGVLTWSVIAFLEPWHMQLLFVLAGAATWYALGHRSAGAYAGERFRRLLIPLGFGILLIVPPQTYLGAWSHGLSASLGGYWNFSGDLTGYSGGWTPAHLWFITYLFLFSLLALPLFVWWRRRPVGARWLLFAMPIVLLLANGLPAPDDGPQNPFYSLALFVGGFMLVADPRAERMIHRAWKPLLAAAAATMAAVLLMGVAGVGNGWTVGSLPDTALRLLGNVNTWVCVLALLGAGHALLNRENKVLRYANEGAYPFYLLHQTVIIAVAYVVVQWNLGLWPKYAAVALGSLAVTLGLYELCVRRFNPMRFLFGLKPRRPAVPAAFGSCVEAESVSGSFVRV
jgi:glucan biosynthesis protein C